MSEYSIEARSLGVVGVAGHNFWVLRDGDGKALAELHGLATDRHTSTAVPIGTDESRHSLRAWHYPHDADYAASIGANVDTTSYIAAEQPLRTIATGPREEILNRWNAAVAVVPELNDLDLDYPNYGFNVFGKTINSNSAYRTFGELMDVPVHNFPGRVEPGIGNRMLPPDRINELRYVAPQQELNNPKANNSQIEERNKALADNSSHEDHASYKRIHDWVSGTGNWSDTEARNVSAALYRKQLEDPSIKQIDSVVGGVGKDGAQNVFAVYNPSGPDERALRTHVDGRVASQQSASENLEQAEIARQSQATEAAKERLQTQAQDAHLSMGTR